MRESYLKVDIRKNVKVDPRKNVWYVRVILEINAIHFGDSRLHWTPAITSVLWETELWDLEITAWQITGGDFPRNLKIITGLSKVLCDIFIHILSEVSEDISICSLLAAFSWCIVPIIDNLHSMPNSQYWSQVTTGTNISCIKLEQKWWNHWLIGRTWWE